jgi:aminoglycoside phosphotransferase (APT) family kinase protein
VSLDRILNGLPSLGKRLFPAGESVRAHDLLRISDGWETDVYSFAAEYGPAGEREREELILRLYPGDDAPQKSVREYSVMEQLYQAGYPVPRVLLLEQDGALLGKPFVIMEKIAGRSLGAISDESPTQKRLELLTLFCRLFADLHALDWRPFAPDPSLYETQDMSEVIDHQLSQWQAYTHALESTAFDPVFGWLCERLPEVEFGQPSVIHWDFHPYNILVRDDGAAFVIDWTNIEVSDYRLDLAWTLLLMSTYGSPESREPVLREYERAAGHSVQQIEYFEVAACLRRLFSILVSLGAGAEALGMRPGAEAMMKDVGHIERVYARLLDRTGIPIAEVEGLLSALA